MKTNYFEGIEPCNDGMFDIPGTIDPGTGRPQVWEPLAVQEYYATQLALNIKNSGYRPQVIAGLARGGLLVAQEVAYKCDEDLGHVVTYQVKGCEGKSLTTTRKIINRPDSSIPSGLRWLIVDDLADECLSLEAVRQDVIDRYDPSETRTAAVEAKRRPTLNRADYIARIISDRWVNYESQAGVDEHLELLSAVVGANPDYCEIMGNFSTKVLLVQNHIVVPNTFDMAA